MENKIYYYLEDVEKAINGHPIMPVTVELDPSNRCQLDCDFCMFRTMRQEKNKIDFPMDIYRYLLLDLKKIQVKSITFTGGGEPTLHNSFNDMVDFAEALGFEFGLVTNGLLLHKVNQPQRFKFIRVSLDAATPETYEKLKRAHAFDAVIQNVKMAIDKGALVGLSYVVNEINRYEIELAQKLAKELSVAYIQFKPAWINGSKFEDYTVPGQNNTISMDRFKATDRVPCHIAGLIGIVGADANVYYCCQYRGDNAFSLGSLNNSSFQDIWARRPYMQPDISKCPNCRYMNYTTAYKKLLERGTLFFKHRNFL